MSEKYFLYARKSTDVEDKQVLSIEAQVTELRKFAADSGLLIVDTVIEKRTAKTPGRPKFGSMLARVEAGEATIFTGPSEDAVSEHGKVSADMAILVPAGTWHNFVNNGTEDLKLYSLYSPAEHDPGTIHVTKAEADAAEAEEHAKPTDQ